MNYQNDNITARAQESQLWEDLSEQQGKTLPYLLERYLLLENWKYLERLERDEDAPATPYDVSYLHLLLAEAATVLLAQEERIRRLEDAMEDVVINLEPNPAVTAPPFRPLGETRPLVAKWNP